MPNLCQTEMEHTARVAKLDAILADAKGRNLTSEEQAQFEAITAECVALEKEIDETHNSRVPERPTLGSARSTNAAGFDREADRESMRQHLRAMGITPVGEASTGPDPKAFERLTPAQADMARALTAMGITPRLPGH